jgi:excisionase family DNA binding protein
MVKLSEALHLVGDVHTIEIKRALKALTIEELERYISQYKKVIQQMRWQRESLMNTDVPKKNNELHTVKETATILKTSTVTIYSLIRSRKLKASKVNTQLRISDEDIYKLLHK